MTGVQTCALPICFPVTIRFSIDKKHIDTCSVSLSDFGAWCHKDECYETDFGTRYYRAPEVILVSEESSTPVDIWAAGCVLYELVTGKFLFDPDKDSKRSRDDYHLYNMSQLFGDFNMGFLKKTKLWKSFFDNKGKLKKFEKIKPVSLEEKLEGYSDPSSNLESLLKGMLTLNPKLRLTAEQCLKHPFLN